jgi:hypothetical protein
MPHNELWQSREREFRILDMLQLLCGRGGGFVHLFDGTIC